MKVFCIIDMQKDFIDGALGTPEAQAIVDPMISFLESLKELPYESYEVIATRDTHYNNYLETNEGKHLPVVHCQIDTEGWLIPDSIYSVLESLEAQVIDKPLFGIPSDRWELILENVDVEEIVVVGLCTDICVISNALALKTAFPEIPVKVYSDLCAGVTPESHEAALLTMKMCQVDVMRSDEDK